MPRPSQSPCCVHAAVLPRRDEADRQLVHFYVGCTKGTYIRTLGHDLATSLGSTGHLVALRREAIGDARVDKAWEVEALVDAIFALIRCVCREGSAAVHALVRAATCPCC